MISAFKAAWRSVIAALRRVKFGVIYYAEIVLPDGSVITLPPTKNVVPQSGISHIAAMIRGTGTPISAWYIGVGEGDFVPSSATTAADLPGSVIEATAYSEAARPIWNNAFDGVSQISSIASRAEYTFTTAKRLRTAFLVSNSTKGGNSGTLLSIARFQTPYDVPAGSVFRLGAVLTLISAS